MNIEEGEIVLCTVDRIVGTVVFVHIDGTELEGNIIFSEIAPGRIRNIREYVVPKKKIICKILRIKGDQINLSLRRVTKKEQKELLEKTRQEQGYKGILKKILKERAEQIIQEMQRIGGVSEFLNNAKENPKELEILVGKEDCRKIFEILKTQKQKTAILKKEFYLRTNASNGVSLIKNVLEIKDTAINYVSAGRYSVKVESSDLKSTDNKLKEILEEIEKKSKKAGTIFSVEKQAV